MCGLCDSNQPSHFKLKGAKLVESFFSFVDTSIYSVGCSFHFVPLDVYVYKNAVPLTRIASIHNSRFLLQIEINSEIDDRWW